MVDHVRVFTREKQELRITAREPLSQSSMIIKVCPLFRGEGNDCSDTQLLSIGINPDVAAVLTDPKPKS